MKKRLLFIAFFICTMLSAAFSQDPILLDVVYEVKYIRDLSQKDNPLITNMILSLGKQSSRYCSERLYNDRKAFVQQKETQPTPSPQPAQVVTGGPALFVGKSGVIINEETIKNRADGTMETTGHIAFKTYYVPEKLPKIDWSLQAEKKTIGKYNCQKAIGKFAGRTYEVWFTTELPFSDGPFKLSGLPGLILEAQDTTHEVIFTFKEIRQSTEQNEIVSSFLKNQSRVKTAKKDYNRSLKAFITDPEATTQALFPEARIHVRNVDDPSSNTVSKVKNYNPIELN